MKLEKFTPNKLLRRWSSDCELVTSISIYEGDDSFEVFRDSLHDEYVARTVLPIVEKLMRQGKENIVVEYTERTYEPSKTHKFLMHPKYRVYQKIRIN